MVKPFRIYQQKILFTRCIMCVLRFVQKCLSARQMAQLIKSEWLAVLIIGILFKYAEVTLIAG